MMRLARKASLLVALYLLASAATAHAECAWVLWAGSQRGSGRCGGSASSEPSSTVAERWTGRLIQVGRSSWQSLLYLATIWSLILS